MVAEKRSITLDSGIVKKVEEKDLMNDKYLLIS
ncbi:hypothetical protein ES703_104283 [subsurface metagenome]